MGMSYVGRGRGKLLLFGEHAAVKGYPALGLALDRGIAITLEPDEALTGWSLEGNEKYGEKENAIARAVMKRLDEGIADLPRSGTIRVDSDLPQGRGFGSSAALCVALAEAGLAASGSAEVIRHRSLVWAIAHHAEAFFHGTPSGIDTGLAALGGLVSFKPQPPDLPQARRIRGWPLHLLVGSVPREGSAKTLIASVREAASSELSPANRSLARLGELAEEATELLESREPQPEKLGALATEAEAELETLGLVAPAVKRLLEAGRAAGALGGKMSGAGGGGAFWLIFRNAEGAEAARSALLSEGGAGAATEGLDFDCLGYGAY